MVATTASRIGSVPLARKAAPLILHKAFIARCFKSISDCSQHA